MFRFFTCALLFCFQSSFAQQSLPEFSPLSSRLHGQFNSTQMAGHYYYYLPDNTGERWIFKVNQQGDITDSLDLAFDGLDRNGVVYSTGDRLFFIGRSNIPFNGTNALEAWESQKRSVLELDADLSIILQQSFEVVPLGAGITVFKASQFTSTLLPEANHISGDTLYSVMPYLLFDVQTNLPLGDQYRFEKLGLNGEVYESFVLETIGSYFTSVFTEKNIYLYGDVGSSTTGGGIFGVQPVGKLNLLGLQLETLEFDTTYSGYFGDGSFGQYHDGRIYSTYVGKYTSEDNCESQTAVIDIRNANFDLLRRFKLPDCNMVVGGRRPFAFSDDGITYYTARNTSGQVGLYKYDADYNLIWNTLYNLPGHLPVSLNLAEDGNVVLECLENFNTLRLYKLTTGGIVSGTAFDRQLESRYFYPNPFRGEVNLAGMEDTNDTTVTATDMSGKTYGPYRLTGNRVNLEHLPAGQYVLSLTEEQSGRMVYYQMAVKMN